MHGFMYLVKAIQGDSNDPKLLLRLLPIVFVGIRLRDCAAIFSMNHLTEESLAKLPQLCSDYFTELFCVEHLVYAHSKKMFDKYGVGLGINTMQGREARQVQIAGYARNSQFKQRWVQVFKHDHVSKM